MPSNYGAQGTGALPVWSANAGPGPDFATCQLYLDCGEVLARWAPLVRHWHDEACRLLLPTVRMLGPGEPVMSLSAHELTAEGRHRRRRLERWTDGLTEELHKLSAHWFDTPAAAVASEMDLDVYRFGGRRHIKLQVSLGFKERPGGLPRVVPALVELVRLMGEVADLTYGEIVVNATNLAPATMLDSALDRDPIESAGASRTVLRGYEWVTVCPKEPADRLGGPEELLATGAFAEVVPLGSGGLLLRATDDPYSYQGELVRAVHRALAPVLPAGEPVSLPGQDLSRVVLADARAAA